MQLYSPLSIHRLTIAGIFFWRLLRLVLLYGLLLKPSASYSDDAISTDQLNSLIGSLDSRTLTERTHAERQLLDLGPEILSRLPAPELIESVSVRESVRRIRTQLERRAAKESSRPSLVSISGERTLLELLQQIQAQTKNRLSLTDTAADQRDTKFTVDWDQATFWECIDELCERGGLRWQFDNSDASMVISKVTSTARRNLAVQQTGPFHLTINKVEIREVVGDARKRLLRVNGRIAVEPRLRPLFLSIAAAKLTATANDGRLLAPWNPNAKYEHPIPDGLREVDVLWDFVLAEDQTVSELTIQARIQCQIAAAIERVVFDQTSQVKGTMRRRGGVTVRLREVAFHTKDAEKLDADFGVAVSYDNGGPAFESHRTWIFHNAVYLETKAGLRTTFAEFETTQQSNGAIAVDYQWRNIAAPASQYVFVYEAPTLLIDVPIDCEFKQVQIVE